MHYVSTRDKNVKLTASQAIAQGLSREGGLLTPAHLPHFTKGQLDRLCQLDYIGRSTEVLGMFLEEFSKEELLRFGQLAYGGGKFDHPSVAPVTHLGEGTEMLELWHGPTCAFKDMALQMLPHLLTASLQKIREKRTACILAATSGDTGKGALEGFRDVEGTYILVFYPQNGVSIIQQLQMTTQEGGNVGVCAVRGNFDDAQSGVKSLFSDPVLREKLNGEGYFFTSANSINWGRVLPQITYYISSYCDLVNQGGLRMGDRLNVCVPTGNFGNILAACYAKQMGLPLGKLLCASNQNNVLTDFIRTGIYDRNRPFHTTISPSMDILISSNLERLLFALTDQDDRRVKGYMEQLSATGRYEVERDLLEKIQIHFDAGFTSDEETKTVIKEVFQEKKTLIDPHTAVAYHVLEAYRRRTGDQTTTLLVSTASPFKFCDSVLDALGVSERREGLELLDQLEQVSGEKIPRPLAEIRSKEIRFTNVISKETMQTAVWEMLLKE